MAWPSGRRSPGHACLQPLEAVALRCHDRPGPIRANTKGAARVRAGSLIGANLVLWPKRIVSGLCPNNQACQVCGSVSIELTLLVVATPRRGPLVATVN